MTGRIDGRLKFLVPALMALALAGACTPATPETQLSWDVNDHLTRPYAYHAAPPVHVARAQPMQGGGARTYVYEGDAPAPGTTPAPRPRYVAPVRQTAALPSGGAAPAFVWPAAGPVISDYGTASNGQRNDGINIAVPMDAPIRASASGTVTYAGNELKGYGNLLLIRHADNYVTAYAHADRLLVRRGDFVAKGQIVGYAGTSGDVTSPQLHFEIRHDTTPVDPRRLLVASNS